jgi:hypothetical protein
MRWDAAQECGMMGWLGRPSPHPHACKEDLLQRSGHVQKQPMPWPPRKVLILEAEQHNIVA